MALQYGIKLYDGSNESGVILQATLGVTPIDKLEEALDEGALHIPITVLDYEYKMFGLLQIEVEDTENEDKNEVFNYLIMSDTVKTISKDGYYSHDLTAIEYTHKLDKYLIHTLTFTKPFIQKRRAPFEYMGDQNVSLIMPKLYDLDEYYFTGKDIVIPQVGQAIFYGVTTNNYDVYVTSDNSNYYNLTTSNRTFNFSTSGAKTISFGYFFDTNTPIEIFKFYIQVVDEVTYTMWDMIERVRANVPIETKANFNTTRIFNIDATLETYFKSIEMPQMFFQKMTARQILNAMFKYINSISRLYYMANETDLLSIDEFNKVVSTYSLEDIVEFETTQDIQQYATKAVGWLERSLQSNFRDNPTVKSPYNERFKTVRAKNVQLTRNGGSFILPLEYPIYEVSKLTATIQQVRFEYQNSLSSVVTKNNDYFELDLTERFLEKSWWDIKDITTDFDTYDELEPLTQFIGLRLNKNGNLFWQRNSKEVDMSLQVGALIKTNLLEEVLVEALNEYITLNAKSILGSETNFPIFFSNAILHGDNLTYTNHFRNVSFNIEYITLANTIAQVEREDVENINYESEMRINQQEQLVDFGRSTRNMYGQLQRSAVPNRTFEKTYTDLSNVIKVGYLDDDGYIITKRSMSLFNEHIDVVYEATLDHNRLNEFNGINQEYRAFEIPTGNQVYDRHDKYIDYVVVTSPTNTTFSEDTTLFSSTALEKLFRKLRGPNTSVTKVSGAFVRTDGFVELYPDDSFVRAITVPVIAKGGKNVISFTFGFDNNQVAGNALKVAGGNYYNTPIRYTNALGFFDELWFGLFTTYQDNDATLTEIFDSYEEIANKEYAYPLYAEATGTAFQQTFDISCGSPLFENVNCNPIMVYKDASSSYRFSYIISLVSLNYNDYVLGQNFATNNPLVENNLIIDGVDTSPKMYLYRYINNEKYNKFDDLQVKNGYNDSVELTTSNTSYSSGVLTFTGSALIDDETHTSWAIGDENGNLYLACNQPYNGVKGLRRHFRPNILQIGNK